MRHVEVLFADCDADGQAVNDQGGAVVDQAFGAQQGDVEVRKRPGENAHLRGVGGRDRGSQNPSRSPWQPGGMGRGRHCSGSSKDQHCAHQDNAAQVLPDLPQGRRQALPIQERRQEEQKHRLRRQMHFTKRGEKTLAAGGAGVVISSMAGHMGEGFPREDERAWAFTPTETDTGT